MTEIEKAIQEFGDNAYHNSLHPEISEKSKAAALAALLTQREIEKNDPLTLEELREMDGEPVWTTPTDYAFEPCWMLVKAKSNYVLADWQFCPFDTYGETWLAYRHKPKEA